jgi:hypothetical protein
MNVTSVSNSPERLTQESLALEVAGERYGYQPLRDHTGFTVSVFTPSESYDVWTVFSVPADAESGTLLVQTGSDVPGVRFTRNTTIPAETTVNQ